MDSKDDISERVCEKELDKIRDICYTVYNERSTMRDGHYTARSNLLFPFVSF